jgi:hypothetical protein
MELSFCFTATFQSLKVACIHKVSLKLSRNISQIPCKQYFQYLLLLTYMQISDHVRNEYLTNAEAWVKCVDATICFQTSHNESYSIQKENYVIKTNSLFFFTYFLFIRKECRLARSPSCLCGVILHLRLFFPTRLDFISKGRYT